MERFSFQPLTLSLLLGETHYNNEVMKQLDNKSCSYFGREYRKCLKGHHHLHTFGVFQSPVSLPMSYRQAVLCK